MFSEAISRGAEKFLLLKKVSEDRLESYSRYNPLNFTHYSSALLDFQSTEKGSLKLEPLVGSVADISSELA